MWYGKDFKIGVLGGGQLGRMLAQSALDFDIQIAAMDSTDEAPSSAIVHEYTRGDIKDYDAVYAFGQGKDVITVEIEHVNTDALKKLESNGVKVFPQPHILEMIQDKGLQKQFYEQNNIPTALYKLIQSKNELKQHLDFLPFFQKLRKGGYDGKGVYNVNDEIAIQKAFDAPSVLEKYVDFQQELSIIVARNESGEIKSYPLVACEFSKELNLVEFLYSPAGVSDEIERKARKIAEDIIRELGMVGILAVELFLTKENELLVNEIAPRTHNSGHHTIESTITSQFEQQLRAITNQKLGATEIVQPGVMVNLIGADDNYGMPIYYGLEEVIGWKGVHPHIYGKAETKPGRKMGHITITDSTIDKAKKKARDVQQLVKVLGSN
jgi:5-(carboxyamino)imidazole ribonucleotide synthase